MRNRISKLFITLFLLCVLAGCQDMDSIYEESMNRLYEHYDSSYVSGPQSIAAIDNFNNACVVVINPTTPDGEYAMVCNLSLWAEDSIHNTEYASWISKEDFDSVLTYDEESYCYLVETLPYTDVSYNIDYDNEDTYEEIGRYYKYLARLIRRNTGEVIGIVLNYRAGYEYDAPTLVDRLVGGIN